MPHRAIRMLILCAAIFLAGSTALFVLRPGGPIGLLAAIALALVVIELLCIAFFPAQVRRILGRTEEEMGKERPTNLGRWVP